MTDSLVDAIANMREKEALQVVREMLQAGEDPLKILDLCREAMVIVGQRFENGEYFLPELMLSGEILKEIAALTQDSMESQGPVKSLGKILIGTVEGDLHDIGKNIVTFLLDVNGFEVMDLGIDVPAQKFVESIRDFQPAIVGLSGFLTLAFDSMKSTVTAIEEAGLRDQVKIMIGGGLVDEKIMTYTGADAYGTDAMVAVSLSRGWTGGE